MKTVFTIVTAMLIMASPAVRAQQPAVNAQATTSTAQPAASKKTIQEKAAIAAAIFTAGFGAFKAIKAATQNSASQAPTSPSDAVPAK